MRAIDDYQRPVERNYEDISFVGDGQGQIAQVHSDDVDRVYPNLGDVVQDVIDYFQRRGKGLHSRQPLPIVDVGPSDFPCAETLDA